MTDINPPADVRNVVDDVLHSRVSGGYYVLPGAHLLRAVDDADRRLERAMDALKAVQLAERRLKAVIDDTLIHLRDNQGRSWEVLSKKTGICPTALSSRAKTRRRKLRDSAEQIAAHRARQQTTQPVLRAVS